MANEKRLIDANALMDTVENTDWYHISLQGNLAHGARSDIHTPLYIAYDIYNAINNATTVDALEVVRCRDCAKDGLTTCPLCWIENHTLNFVNHDPNFYCGAAERKTDND